MQIGMYLSFLGKPNGTYFRSACLGRERGRGRGGGVCRADLRWKEGDLDGVSMAMVVGDLRIRLGTTSWLEEV